MIKNKVERYPKNAEGLFYVENGMCIACGVPETVAPDLMTHERNPEIGYHCYFKKQPSTAQEVEQAINAVIDSCCGAVCYSGDAPEILRRLAEGDESLFIKTLLPNNK